MGKPTTGRWERYATPVTILLSALGLVVTILVSQSQLRSSARQFERTIAQNQYSDIVAGLDSPSVGVQVNSLRRLVQFVSDRANFDDPAEADDAVLNAAQTLMAFIQDESTSPGVEGLGDYRDPQPIVVSRALNELRRLVRTTDLRVALDLSRGDFHGIDVADLRPGGSFFASGADFRMATATGWDLSGATSVNLGSAFFTCANLQTSDLGSAYLGGADLTGANLRGADLGEVRGLTSEQISGAVVGERTILPDGVRTPTRAWGWQEGPEGGWTPTAQCSAAVESMTRLPSGTGFSSRLPCPGRGRGSFPPALAAPEREAIARVCALRARLGAGAP